MKNMTPIENYIKDSFPKVTHVKSIIELKESIWTLCWSATDRLRGNEPWHVINIKLCEEGITMKRSRMLNTFHGFDAAIGFVLSNAMNEHKS